jgi:hypothetical protein
MIKIYGELSQTPEQLTFPELSALSIALTPDAMEKFAAFVAHAASEMKRLGPDYDHVHFMDFCKEWDETCPEIQLTRIYGDASTK